MPQNNYEFKRYFVLADGTEITGSMGDTGNNSAWLTIEDPYTFVELATLFSDSEKLSEITVYYTEQVTVKYEGFTKLTSIQQELNGTFNVRLIKP